MMINWKKRLTNPTFWTGAVALFLSSTRIQPETLTSWAALKTAMLSLLLNPYLLCCFVIALIGQINNPTTKGLKD